VFERIFKNHEIATTNVEQSHYYQPFQSEFIWMFDFFGLSKHPWEVDELLCSLFVSTGGVSCGTCVRVQIPVSIKKES